MRSVSGSVMGFIALSYRAWFRLRPPPRRRRGSGGSALRRSAFSL
ncbi:MAG: hypothetical protein AVDCRST_MAG77-511 [uncultured Chloroflexi bacterium]|uniref:Uncharacterized protein n=1 Tax=uncultured Chloroflexota bacterium TaxID=166587 RepID=A0A6J4H7G3_9CHLR|nr:MAG: hypothetical protein AVDCRST_MAG77-511 [uncultured Chloroflexota bacterium]